MADNAIPDGYHAVTPYLTVQSAATLLEFVKAAFHAEERVRMERDDGSIAHAEVTIGDSVIMIGEATDEWPAMPGNVHLYVGDCDATYHRALDAGATSIREPVDEPYGDRMAGVRDSLGDQWWIATRITGRSAEST